MRFIPLLQFCRCLSVLFLTIAGSRSFADERPNIVILLSDDHRWSDYSFLGPTEAQTPHLDRLASQSLVFTRGYVPTSLCRPSLASIITGKYPHQHGVTGNDPRNQKQTAAGRQTVVDRFLKNPRLPQLLREAGYRTFQSGKWWEGNYVNGGFDSGMTHGDIKRGGRHGDEGLKIGREGLQPIRNFLDQVAQEQRPFFLWYAPLLPHRPHTPPPEFLSRFQQSARPAPVAKYLAMIAWWDQTCGDLLQELDHRELSGNTIVVYLADNGWTQTPGPDSNGAVGGSRGKRSAYDGGTRTPIMFRWPKKIAPRRDDLHLASSIDLLPTLVSAAGLKPPSELPGIDLLGPAQLETRDAIFGEIFTHDIPDINVPVTGLLDRWIIAGNWKLIVPTGSDPGDFGPTAPALFDLLKDPEEQTDLAAQHPERVAELRSRLDSWWSAQSPEK